jgi:ADP-heptose:LPS heptosyltransferase
MRSSLVTRHSSLVADPKSPRLLIVRAGAIGDTLMVTPLIRALRQTFPEGLLVCLCSNSAGDVIRYNPHLNRVVPLAYRHLPLWTSPEKWRILRDLRSLRLDCALVLESHPSLVTLGRRARAQQVITYGVVPEGDGFERAVFDPQKHCIENHLRAAAPLGVQPSGYEMELHYPSEFSHAMRQRLDESGIGEKDCLVGIHPGWGGRQHALDRTRLRSWPAQNFARVIRWLVKSKEARAVLTGSSADRPLTEYIARSAGVACLDLAGKLSLLELAALIRRLDLYLTVDSGPAHMAAALGTPLITLWGPGIFEQTSPVHSRGPAQVLYHRVLCAPCYGTPLVKTCQDNICMKQIEVTEVTEAVSQMLELSHVCGIRAC